MGKIFILLAILLLRLPSIIILPNLINRTTHTLANLIIVLIFINASLNKRRKIKEIIKRKKFLSSVILANSIILSLSIINAINIVSFFKSYKSFIISYILYFTILLYFSRHETYKIIKVLLYSLIINLLLEFIIYFKLIPLYNIIKFLHPEEAIFMEYQITRNRYFINTFDEAFVPIIILLMLKDKNLNQFFTYIILLLGITFTTTVSNWRTKQLIFFFSFFITIIYLLKTKKSKLNKLKIYLLLIIILTTIPLFNIISIHFTKQSSITRLVNPSKEDLYNIESRFKLWLNALEIGKSHLILGVGLGNFFDYWYNPEKTKSLYLNNNKIIPIESPHNILSKLFAETGILGSISYVVLLFYLFINDIKLINEKNYTKVSIILSFWNLFIFALFNPAVGTSYLGLFWILRSIIDLL